MRSFTGFAVVLLAGTAAWPAAAAESHASVTVTAIFSTRTSLDVSTHILHFDATEPEQPATASVVFSAKARTGAGSEVMLSVEPLRDVDGPGGADVESSVTFEGEGEGTRSGRLASAKPAVAARWVGSGRRDGRLIFALRAAAGGSCVLPLRFVLSAP